MVDSDSGDMRESQLRGILKGTDTQNKGESSASDSSGNTIRKKLTFADDDVQVESTQLSEEQEAQGHAIVTILTYIRKFSQWYSGLKDSDFKKPVYWDDKGFLGEALSKYISNLATEAYQVQMGLMDAVSEEEMHKIHAEDEEDDCLCRNRMRGAGNPFPKAEAAKDTEGNLVATKRQMFDEFREIYMAMSGLCESMVTGKPNDSITQDLQKLANSLSDMTSYELTENIEIEDIRYGREEEIEKLSFEVPSITALFSSSTAISRWEEKESYEDPLEADNEANDAHALPEISDVDEQLEEPDNPELSKANHANFNLSKIARGKALDRYRALGSEEAEDKSNFTKPALEKWMSPLSERYL